MIATIIAIVIFVVSFLNGPYLLHNGEPFSLKLAAISLVCLISFVIVTTKALAPKRAGDIFVERF